MARAARVRILYTGYEHSSSMYGTNVDNWKDKWRSAFKKNNAWNSKKFRRVSSRHNRLRNLFVVNAFSRVKKEMKKLFN